MFLAVDSFWEMAGHWLRFISAHGALFLTGTGCPLISLWNMGLWSLQVLCSRSLLLPLVRGLTKKAELLNSHCSLGVVLSRKGLLAWRRFGWKPALRSSFLHHVVISVIATAEALPHPLMGYGEYFWLRGPRLERSPISGAFHEACWSW